MLKLKTPIKILAINPGWRYLGIAIFNDSDLREWRLKVLSGRKPKERIQRAKEIVSEFIERSESNILAVKELHPSRSSANLRKLTAKIKAYCRGRKMKIFSYTLKDLESFFGPAEKINKKRLAEFIVSEYPALQYELKHEQRNKNPYFLRLFEAVALGLVCYQKNKDYF
jgi:hypothetical protein